MVKHIGHICYIYQPWQCKLPFASVHSPIWVWVGERSWSGGGAATSSALQSLENTLSVHCPASNWPACRLLKQSPSRCCYVHWLPFWKFLFQNPLAEQLAEGYLKGRFVLMPATWLLCCRCSRQWWAGASKASKTFLIANPGRGGWFVFAKDLLWKQSKSDNYALHLLSTRALMIMS